MTLQLIETNLQQECLRLRRALVAPATISGYGYDWKLFEAWCGEHQRQCLPASLETISFYLTDILQGRKISTAQRRCCAIAYYHRQESLPSPITGEIRELLVGAQRMRGEKPRQVKALSLVQLRDISAALARQTSDRAARDRALIVFGFATALRRSNLAQLDLADVEFGEQGAVVQIRREKQDQEGRGRLIGIPRGREPQTCPIAALDGWIARRGHVAGPLFTRLDEKHRGKRMDGECVIRVVKRAMVNLGEDPEEYGAHSLRAGFVTAAGEAGVSPLHIAHHTGHRSLQVLQKYFRRTDLFRSNVCTAIGL